MSSKWLNSVVRITSSDSNVGGYGTGFIIHYHDQVAYILTCSHVMYASGGPQSVLVNDHQAQVVTCGSEDGIEGIDLTILRVEGLENKSSLYLCSLARRGKTFIIPGFYSSTVQSPKSQNKLTIIMKPLHCVLDERLAVGTKMSNFVDVWDLSIVGDNRLEPGYSGSPVIDEASGFVVGVISTRNTQDGGKRGRAISIEELKNLRSKIPLSLSNINPLQNLIDYDPDVGGEGMLTRLTALANLAKIIGDLKITKNDLKIFYQRSVPDDLLAIGKWAYPKDDSSAVSLLQVLQKLDHTSLTENIIPPILKFVEQLIKHTTIHNKDPHAELKKWLDASIHIWDVSSQVLQQYVNPSLPLQKKERITDHSAIDIESSSPCLLIRLERKKGSKSFFVKAWLYCDRSETLVPLPLSANSKIAEKSYTSNNVSVFLKEIFEDIMNYDKIDMKEKAKLRIEFFLPSELFDEPVDNWTIQNDNRALGMLYQVVIRSSERIKLNEAFWLEKSERVYNHSKMLNEKSIHWIHDSLEDHGTEIYTKICAHLVEPDIVCLCMMTIPSLVALATDKKELFHAIVISGTPIALWPRKIPDEIEHIFRAQETMKLLLLDNEVSKIPEIVLQHRRNARRGIDTHHLGYNLTLLWDRCDDTKRLPPKDTRLKLTKMRK